MGTFVDGLKPWISRELKLKQSRRLQEIMKMTGILEESYNSEKKQVKDLGDSKYQNYVKYKFSRKKKQVVEDPSKEKKEIKILSKQELQNRMNKYLCFKYVEKWDKGPQMQIWTSFHD